MRDFPPERSSRRVVLRACVVAAALAAGGVDAADSLRAREEMLDAIRATVRETRHSIGRDALAPAVMAAMARVPRHEFVPDEMRSLAYLNRPLPIGHGQTISQPYIVALMTDLLGLTAHSRVLEVGTGSGYQAAVLAEVAAQVNTMEIIEPLAVQARQRLRRLGYRNVRARLADGYYGWPEDGPYDGIIVTAAAAHVPPPLVAQLRVGGVMVIPVGGRFTVQQLLLIEKLDEQQV